MTVRLKNVSSTGWRGRDFDGKELVAEPGQEVEMTAPRARKAMDDYPGKFELVDQPHVPRGMMEPDPSVEAPPLVLLEQPQPKIKKHKR